MAAVIDLSADDDAPTPCVVGSSSDAPLDLDAEGSPWELNELEEMQALDKLEASVLAQYAPAIAETASEEWTRLVLEQLTPTRTPSCGCRRASARSAWRLAMAAIIIHLPRGRRHRGDRPVGVGLRHRPLRLDLRRHHPRSFICHEPTNKLCKS